MTDQAPETRTDRAPESPIPTALTPATANADTVQAFLFALAEEDFDTVESLAAAELIWQNVGLPSIRGRHRIMKLLRRGEGTFGFGVKFHNVAEDGGTVLTERTDAIIIGPLRLQFWVWGRFEVHEGKITLWRDYFDFFDIMVKAPLRALAGLVFPSLRPTF